MISEPAHQILEKRRDKCRDTYFSRGLYDSVHIDVAGTRRHKVHCLTCKNRYRQRKNNRKSGKNKYEDHKRNISADILKQSLHGFFAALVLHVITNYRVAISSWDTTLMPALVSAACAAL